jgi:hypothetical protein
VEEEYVTGNALMGLFSCLGMFGLGSEKGKAYECETVMYIHPINEMYCSSSKLNSHANNNASSNLIPCENLRNRSFISVPLAKSYP